MQQKQVDQAKTMQQVQNIISRDTVPAAEEEIKEGTGKIQYDGEMDGTKIKLTEINGQIKELYIDSKKIPAEEYDKYKTLIDKLHQQMKEQTLQLKVQKAEMMKQKEIMQKEMLIMKQKAEEDYKNQKLLLEESQQQMQKEMEIMKKNAELMKVETQKMQEDYTKQQKIFMEKQIEFQKKAIELKKEMEKMKKTMKDSLMIKPAVPAKPVTYTTPSLAKPFDEFKTTVAIKPITASALTTVAVTPMKSMEPVLTTTKAVSFKPFTAVSVNPLSEDIINELEKENIISDRKNISFKLTSNELIVNGVKQSAEIHKKILSKYVKKPGDTFSLSYSNHD